MKASAICGAIGAPLASLFLLGASGPSTPQLWTPAEISTEGYEASPTFTPDGREMYYLGASKTFSAFRILVSRCEAGRWSAGQSVSFAAPAPTIEADPFVTPDGSRLYFVSARHDPKNEGFDIYYVDRLKDGAWGKPVHLPYPINSPTSELLPRLDRSGRLYFGSDRPGGLGQSDIYTAVEVAPGQWRVENLSAPVSTAANEYEAEVSRDGKSLVVVADRGDRSHLYRYRKTKKGWIELGRVPARQDVFQVGPVLSPKGERLLFAQAYEQRSGELFLVDIKNGSREVWPPVCS